MKKSLKQRTLEHLRKCGVWVNGAFYEKMAMELGYKGSNVSRRLRELENDNEIERKEVKGKRAKSVWYRAKKPYKRVVYKIPALDKELVRYETDI